VRGVEDGSPAAAAGLAGGDLITTANGTDVRNADDLWAVLDALGDADAIDLGIVHGADELTVRVTFDAAAATEEEGSA